MPQNTSLVFVIEDDPFIKGILHQKFELAGIRLMSASDGKSGLDLIKDILQKEPISLILLDIILPDIDGFLILKQLKENPITKEIPVAMLSNLGQSSEIDRAKLLGALDFIIKANVTPNEIIEKVRGLLSRT